MTGTSHRSAASESRRGLSFGADVDGGFDGDLYAGSSSLHGTSNSIDALDEAADPYSAESAAALERALLSRRPATAEPISAPSSVLAAADAAAAAYAKNADPFEGTRPRTIAERESKYHARGRRIVELRAKGLDTNSSKLDVPAPVDDDVPPPVPVSVPAPAQPPLSATVTRKRRRWDVAPESSTVTSDPSAATPAEVAARAAAAAINASEVPAAALPPRAPGVTRTSRWDAAPSSVVNGGVSTVTASMSAASTSRSRWDATPVAPPASKRSRWDETPSVPGAGVQSAITPATASLLDTPIVGAGGMTAEALHASRWQADVEERNRPLSDADLDALLPSDGYIILEQPKGYIPLRTPVRMIMNAALATPVSAAAATPLYSMPTEGGIDKNSLGIPVEMPDGLQGLNMKPEDYANFEDVLDKNAAKDDDLPDEVRKKRQIMRLLLKIKNGTPAVRKVAMRQITDKARGFGADALFDQILPLLMSQTLEDQERHLYVKVVDRVLYKLGDLVRPHVHKILVVIAPMLIADEYYARVEGREIISNLAKVAGLPTMIATMRPDIDHQDEYVRNTTARAFAVVASALGIPSMLLFLKAVCHSRKSWHARHTGHKIVQQIAKLMGVAVLPYLRALVEIVQDGLTDEQGKVRLITALALAALAEASAPYGIESFDSVIKPLWQGIHFHRGKTLAAFLKAIGYIIPLMHAEHANYYAREVTIILIREFRSQDEEMKQVVLKVVQQCVSCEGVESDYVRTEVVPDYFQSFWVRRMALDRRNFRAVVETTLEIALKIGGAEVIAYLVDGLRNESEPFRRMVVDAVEKIATELGLTDIDTRLEERLIDGLLFAFQEQSTSTSGDSPIVLKALSVVVEKLGLRAKPYLHKIIGIVKWRLNNKNATVREYAADLTANLAATMKLCDEEGLMGHMGEVLEQYLGEEFPDVLGSILRALKAIVEVIGITQMHPPIRDLLPRLTPILKNRHEKVQENCILLVGRIADRGAEYVSAKEWMRICFELLELLKAPRKAIRKSAVSTFGYIAKAIGPSNVLGTLLNNLKVQERTQRVCTTVAIAIVADQCKPYTVLPSLMNEYRIPELNVQNGVLKSLSFLFEYIGDAAGDYIYAVTPVLEDALIDRDLVHRQTACSAVAHLALGVRGMGYEDALIHLLNHVWPNAFETSPHVINAVMSAIQGCTVSVGAGPILLYVLQGLFHPARKVREVYWKIYNNLYIYAQDALVPAYPSLDTPDLVADGDGMLEQPYTRHELFLMI